MVLLGAHICVAFVGLRVACVWVLMRLCVSPSWGWVCRLCGVAVGHRAGGVAWPCGQVFNSSGCVVYVSPLCVLRSSRKPLVPNSVCNCSRV